MSIRLLCNLIFFGIWNQWSVKLHDRTRSSLISVNPQTIFIIFTQPAHIMSFETACEWGLKICGILLFICSSSNFVTKYTRLWSVLSRLKKQLPSAVNTTNGILGTVPETFTSLIVLFIWRKVSDKILWIDCTRQFTRHQHPSFYGLLLTLRSVPIWSRQVGNCTNNRR